MHRLARLVGAMYSVYRSKHALSAGENWKFGGPAVEHLGGRKTVNYRGPNSPRWRCISSGTPPCASLRSAACVVPAVRAWVSALARVPSNKVAQLPSHRRLACA